MSYELLLSPIKIRELELKNRVVLPGMYTKMSSDGGFVTQRLIDYYTARAAGGCGLVILEAAGVHAPTAPRNFLSVSEDQHYAGLKDLTDAIHAVDGKAAVQLWQGGLVATMQDPDCYTVFPSELEAFGLEGSSEETILQVIQAFGDAAARCVQAGFDTLEFHCAHNYSPHSFLTPALNKRTDKWGGSFENCMRYPLEIIKSIRASIPDGMPLFMRVSVQDDYWPDGITIEMMIEYLKKAKEAGVDVVDCSRGNVLTPAVDYEVPSINIARGFNIDNALAIKKGTDLITMGVGRINDPDQAEDILSKGLDLVGIGRAQISDPNFVSKVQAGRVDDIVRCVACNQGCYDSVMDAAAQHITCLQNPAVGNEAKFDAKLSETVEPKKVLVIGGGMAGLEAAARLKARGHNPILCEKSDALGGQFLLAGLAPRKDEMRHAALARGRQLVRQGVDIRLDTFVDERLIQDIAPDVAVVASGAIPIKLRVPQSENANVWGFAEVLEGGGNLSGRVVIIGGGLVGLEVAEYLAERNDDVTEVTVVEMLKKAGADLGTSRINGVMDNLREHNVAIKVNCTCVEIRDDSVVVEKKDAQEIIECDGVVIAVGLVAQESADLVKFLESKGILSYVVGDAAKARRALNAVKEAAEAANAI